MEDEKEEHLIKALDRIENVGCQEMEYESRRLICMGYQFEGGFG